MDSYAEDEPGMLSLKSDDYRASENDKDGSVVDIEVSESAPSLLPDGLKHRKRSIVAALPQEVIEQILYLADPETFASLVLVNRAWRKAAEDPQLYAYQLSRCPSFAAKKNSFPEPYKEDSLLKFKRLLVTEAKRYLFAVFMRPQQTTINLISTTTSSSAAFPHGEKFEFNFSPSAQFCLAISSSRIIVLDTSSAEINVKRELKVVRRPLSAFILHTGASLVVLMTPHKVNLYDLTNEKPKLSRSLELEGPAHTVTMSGGGEVLAAAHEGGVEVISLRENALPTERRGVKCDRVDGLSFSCDGTMLLGTTQNSKSPSTVILSAPYFTDAADHDMDHAQVISHMWTSQIIFPNSSRDCSHAALLPRKDDHNSNWTLAYDRTFESFRAVRSDDLRNGTTYFAGPNPRPEREMQRSKSLLLPVTLPTITPSGELVAAAFLGSEIWLYGVPEDLDNSNSAAKLQNARPGDSGSNSVILGSDAQGDSSERNETLPRWQVLVDKDRYVIAKGRRIANVAGVSKICWNVAIPTREPLQNIKERLVIAAPGGVSGSPDMEHEDMPSLDGGRLVCLDFNATPQSGASREVTIEIGNVEPQLLEEERTDIEAEIAIVRRRTVARRENVPRSMIASVADVLRPVGEERPTVVRASSSAGFGLDHTTSEAPANTDADAPPSPTSSAGVTMEQAAEAFDGSYSHTSPRSRGILYRSATAVETNRRRHPPVTPSGRVEYRRTDGTELPHESDADNWVPPPPPYTKEPVDHLPQHLRNILTSQTSVASASIPSSENTSQTNLPDTTTTSSGNRASLAAPSQGSAAVSREPSFENELRQEAPLHRRLSSSDSVPSSIASTTQNPKPSRPVSQYSIPRRPVARPNAAYENRLSTITDASSRRRSLADNVREGTSSPSWLSRHDSNRSTSPELRRNEMSRSASLRQSTSSTPSSRSPSSSSRRPLSSYEPRSSLYRAALQPAPSIAPIREPVPPPEIRQSPNRSSIVSVASTRRSTSLTLSGSNLQQRLDYPLPPPPNSSHGIGEGSPISPTTAVTNSTETSARDTSPTPVQPAVRQSMRRSTYSSSQASDQPSPLSVAPSGPQSVPHPTSQPASQRLSQQISQPSPQPSPRPQRPRELSAYQIMQQHNEQNQQRLSQQQRPTEQLPPPPPVPDFSSGASPTRRSSRFRSPFRISRAVGSSHALNRATSALSLRPSDNERSQTPQPATSHSTAALPITTSARPQSRAESIRARSKERISRRISRVLNNQGHSHRHRNHGDGRDKENIPPVPPVPEIPQGAMSFASTRAGNWTADHPGHVRENSYSYIDRGRRRGGAEQEEVWTGTAEGATRTVVSSGGHNGKSKRRKGRDKDGSCIVM